MNLDSPSRLWTLRDQWGKPILFDQPDGQRWFQIFNTSTHWKFHSIVLNYPDGTMVTMQGRMLEDEMMVTMQGRMLEDEMTWSARITYRIYATVDRLKTWYRRNF